MTVSDVYTFPTVWMAVKTFILLLCADEKVFCFITFANILGSNVKAEETFDLVSTPYLGLGVLSNIVLTEKTENVLK